jgi:hypothetical protein
MRKLMLLGVFGLLLGVTDAKADRWKDKHRGRGPAYGYSYGPSYGYNGPRYAPPPMRREFYGRAPSPRHVWVPGYYTWAGHDYAWHNGYWAMPPRPQAMWVPGYWRPQNGIQVFINGFWR